MKKILLVALLLFIFISKISTINIYPFPTESKKREFIMNGDPTVVEFPNKYKPYSCVLSSLIADLRGAVCVQLK